MSLDKNKREIESALSVLVGENFRYISRAGNMITLGFGEDIMHIRYNGEAAVLARFAVHIQASWRITINESISLGSYDFYIPKEGVSYEEFQKDENFGFGISLFDEKSKNLNEYLLSVPVRVDDIVANNFGDLHILLENDTSVEVFINCSEPGESWRFFETGTDERHFVVFDEDEN